MIKCPKFSAATLSEDTPTLTPLHIAATRNTMSKKEREAFAATLPTKVQLMLNQPFGKDNLNQSFKAEARLHHVLLPLFRSGFLGDDDWANLGAGCKEARTIIDLLGEHGGIDFRPL